MKIIISYCLLLFSAFHLSAQAPTFQTTNYNIEDGLPSNECHDILQDSTGYIWIATDRGLVRFNGYEFKTYGVPEGLTDLSCLDMIFDQDQNIWINTLSGKIFIYHQKLDSISLYPHQAVIDSFLVHGQIDDLALGKKDNKLHLPIRGVGFLIIDNKTGVYTLKRSVEKEKGKVMFLDQVADRFLISVDDRTEDIAKLRTCNEDFNSINSDCQHYLEYNNTLLKGQSNTSSTDQKTERIFRLDTNIIMIQYLGVNYFLGQKKVIGIKSTPFSFLEIIPYKENDFLAGMHNKKGLCYFSDIEKLIANEPTSLIKNVSISRILQDRAGNIWCSSLENGIYYLRKETINSLPLSNLDKASISAIEIGGDNFFFVKDKKKLFELKKEYALLIDENTEIRSINYADSLALLLISSAFSSKALDKNNKHKKIKTQNPLFEHRKDQIPSFNSFVFKKNELFFSASNTLVVYNNIDSTEIYYSSRDEQVRLRVLAVEKINSDSFLLGTTNGLKLYSNKSIKRLKKYPQALQNRINVIKKTKNWYVFGTQGNGLVFWDSKDRLIVLRKSDGIISNNIESLFIDDQENIYLCTKSGLSKVWFNESNEIQIKNYTTFHGLPSNEVNDVDQLGDTIYIATGKGLATLVQDPVAAKLHQPFFKTIQVNNTIYPFNESPTKFAHRENSMQIAYQTIDYKMQSKIPYRYKLNEGDWLTTYATEINLPALSSGDYTLSLASKNRDDRWSKTITYNFKIQTPWWQRAWFLLLSLALLGLGGYFFYKMRINRLKAKVAIEREMYELERSALQAQMNPHFIFNCLNSIQNFIMDNDKENAMEYLGKFARLIRQSLNASTAKTIPLNIEIKMLENYLALEKLRFKNKFDFKITLSDDLDPEEIKIPPLLIQPFVENAIIHGIKDKVKSGLVIIKFSKINAHQLRVFIKDNGTGIQSGKVSKTHQSLGTSITAKRLAFNNQSKDEAFEILPQTSAAGTTIQITIKV